MAVQQANDDATKARIVSHLNNDHSESLVRYLEHYCELSSWRAYDARMSAISLHEMTFTCGDGIYRIPLVPPMKSYRDARERAVQMDKECLQALRRSDITIKDFAPPTGLFAFIFVGISAVVLTYSQRWLFESGQLVERLLGSGFAQFSFAIQPYLLAFILFMHSWETLYMVRYKLVTHSVNPRTRIFWLWTGTTFVEGGFSFWRFNDLVRAKREAKAKQQH
ncbi:hypothetical protein LTR53_002376 [Teratosphaeriaceae sp. CCFEE 6253]|nr:hypothetical protein LTR53_002376 [Teratosphaeriaceae sp. CCFEE 6253]